MHKIHFQSGKWFMQAAPHDGARITRLAYDGFGLLTAVPKRFRPPKKDYGLYEKRPVFGYDDCFPSVDAGRFPGRSWRIPDHGELCWLPWKAQPAHGGLRFAVASQRLPLAFNRTMLFFDNRLSWQFEVRSEAAGPLTFQHVMHPLMPLDAIDLAALRLPDCDMVYDEISKRPAGDKAKPIHGSRSSALNIQRLLVSTPPGKFRMLVLRGIKSGGFTIGFNNGMRLRVKFPRRYFNSLGVWWNNRGYPDEPGLRRCECAFEPIPGRASSLARAVRSGGAMIVQPGQNLAWKVEWEMNSPQKNKELKDSVKHVM